MPRLVGALAKEAKASCVVSTLANQPWPWRFESSLAGGTVDARAVLSWAAMGNGYLARCGLDNKAH